MKVARIAAASLALICCFTATLPAEELHETWLKYMVGKWKFTLGEMSGEQTTEAAPGVQAVVFRAVATKDFAIMGIIGWDSDRKMLVETDYSVSNVRILRKYTEITQDKIRGSNERWVDGSGTLETVEYRRISDNEMHLVGTARNGEEWMVKFERIKDR